MKTMPRDRRSKPRSSGRRAVVLAALGAFVLVDVVLVGYALTSDRGDSTGQGVQAPATTSAPAATPTPTPTTPPTPVALTSPSVYLSAVDSSTAYRAVAGACPADQPATLEKTTDGGVTWVGSTVSTGLTSIARLQAVDSTFAYVVGSGGAECELGFTATYSSGLGFQTYPDRLLATWYLDRSQALPVHSPVGSFEAPCDDIVSLTPGSDAQAAALCSNGTVFQTQDGAASWDSGVQVAGIQAVSTASDGGYLLAVSGSTPECTGMSISTLSTTGALDLAGCNSAEQSADGVALSQTDSSIWLQAGGQVSVSADGGTTWSRD